LVGGKLAQMGLGEFEFGSELWVAAELLKGVVERLEREEWFEIGWS